MTDYSTAGLKKLLRSTHEVPLTRDELVELEEMFLKATSHFKNLIDAKVAIYGSRHGGRRQVGVLSWEPPAAIRATRLDGEEFVPSDFKAVGTLLNELYTEAARATYARKSRDLELAKIRDDLKCWRPASPVERAEPGVRAEPEGSE